MMIYYSIPIIAALALLLALYFYRSVVKEDMGTEKMKDIAGAISEGAHAFLHSEYRVLLIFVIVLFFCIDICPHAIVEYVPAQSLVLKTCCNQVVCTRMLPDILNYSEKFLVCASSSCYSKHLAILFVRTFSIQIVADTQASKSFYIHLTSNLYLCHSAPPCLRWFCVYCIIIIT